jgi:hypothetical protein
MTDFNNNMKGALFRADPEKRKSDKSPDFNGHIEIDGQKFWISAWLKTAKASGKRFLSLSLTAAEQSDANPGERAKSADDFLNGANSKSAKPADTPAADDDPPWPPLKPANGGVDDEIPHT